MISSTSLASAFLLVSMLVPALAQDQQGTATFQTRQTWSFQADGVSFSNEFSGARLNDVTRTGKLSYQISISPEAHPINDSAWYAFRVWSKRSRKIELTLAYTGGTHRYRPKVRVGDGEWKAIPGVAVANRKKQAVFPLEVSSAVRMVAGQPLITLEDQMAWSKSLAKEASVTYREIGNSVQGRPVPMLVSKAASPASARTLIVMTGQHPPEFTSVVGFRASMDVLLGETELARDFRRHFNIAIFPLMNPDGWHHGHWRCNANGIDPNRSWTEHGTNEVPEVRHAIKAIRELPNPVLFLDYHSTNKNVLYTGPDDDCEPRHVVPEFHEALSRRAPEWPWSRETSHISKSPSGSSGPPSRVWTTRELKIPSVTWEFADIAGRARLAKVPAVGAEEVMRLLIRLGRDDTKPMFRCDFEAAGEERSGAIKARIEGAASRATTAGFNKEALSFAGPETRIIIPDFDYGSKDGAAISLWLKMDRSSLADGDFTGIYCHADPGQLHSVRVGHRKSSSSFIVNVRDYNDSLDDKGISLKEAKVMDGKWHHLGVVMTPGKGTTVYLNGILQGSSESGGDAFDPPGEIHIGIDHEAAPATRFKGELDDLRIYGNSLSPYSLTAIRYPDWIGN